MRRRLLDVHAGNQAIGEAIGVMDDGVDEEIALHVVDNLMHLDDPKAFVGWTNGEGIDMRVENSPLPGPVSTDRLASVLVAALHAIGPLHLRVQAGENGIHAAGVEIGVGTCEQIFC